MKKLLILALLFVGCKSSPSKEEIMAQERTKGYCVVVYKKPNLNQQECWDGRYTKKECRELSDTYPNSIEASFYNRVSIHTPERNCEQYCDNMFMIANEKFAVEDLGRLTQEDKDAWCVVKK